MNNEISCFIDDYVKEIRNDTAAIFAGAGFSKAAGYVDWKKLLGEIANYLQLDLDKESDLISVAQYCYNQDNSKTRIRKTIIDEFSKEKEIDENHKIMARLPIFTYWTTNYDSLIEDALGDAHRVVDVKYTNKQISCTKPNRDAVLYKMHGDKEHPDDVVIIKKDYENYHKSHYPFMTTLSGDLISKTFLFIGFSFADPNINYILSRIIVDYEEQDKLHYALLKSINRQDCDSDEDFSYKQRKQNFFIKDLERYHVKALMVDDYSEITEILKEIEQRLNRKNIFISGSAAEYGENFSQDTAYHFLSELSKRILDEGFNIISGFGLGVGSAVITGALTQIYDIEKKSIDDKRLILRPFPQNIPDKEKREKLWYRYRQDILSRAGISIFVFGNKKTTDGEIVDADGVQAEFDIALEKQNYLIPVGCTGSKSKTLWDKVHDNIEKYYPGKDIKSAKSYLENLNNFKDIDTLIKDILDFINFLSK